MKRELTERREILRKGGSKKGKNGKEKRGRNKGKKEGNVE